MQAVSVFFQKGQALRMQNLEISSKPVFLFKTHVSYSLWASLANFREASNQFFPSLASSSSSLSSNFFVLLAVIRDGGNKYTKPHHQPLDMMTSFIACRAPVSHQTLPATPVKLFRAKVLKHFSRPFIKIEHVKLQAQGEP